MISANDIRRKCSYGITAKIFRASLACCMNNIINWSGPCQRGTYVAYNQRKIFSVKKLGEALICFVSASCDTNDMDLPTTGMLTESQAQRLADAGLYAYNHNLDTSKEHYNEIITTRTYNDRLQTLDNVRKTGITVCCGGIIGLGETHTDRIQMLHTLATMPAHPESVPINALVPIAGTPLEHNTKVAIWDMVRMIATARILMPKTMVRLSAGRTDMSIAEQALCFMAGANSIFAGDKLLTTPNPSFDEDNAMFQLLGLKPRTAFKEEKQYLSEMAEA